MAGEANDKLAMTLATLDAVDDVLAAFLGRVAVILRVLPSPLKHQDRRDALRQIDTAIAYYFGATQSEAMRSALYRALDRQLTVTANLPAQRMVKTVRAAVEARNPDLWLTILRKASPTSPDPFLRAVALTPSGTDTIARERILRSRSLDPNRRWVKGDGTTVSNYRLSDRVWQIGKQTRTAIDDRLRLGITRGEDALSIADDLVKHLRANQQPEIITQGGKVIRRKNLTLAPGRGGYGSYQARRLARTEVTHVHGAATIETVRITPGSKGVGWRLSARHPKPDECSDYASADNYGLGAGVYPVDRVPAFPAHPQDLCTLVPVMPSREEIVATLLRRYGS